MCDTPFRRSKPRSSRAFASSSVDVSGLAAQPPGDEDAAVVRDLHRRPAVLGRHREDDLAVPDDRVDMRDVAGHELLEQARGSFVPAAVSAGQRSSAEAIFRMPVDAADDRGFSTHGAGTRAVQSCSAWSLKTAVNSGTRSPMRCAWRRMVSLSRKREPTVRPKPWT